MGKRKIEIEKIPDRQKRNVTFTKRRDGLFKKAETACQTFGLQIGIVVFSPAGKPFTFCNSSSVSVDAIIDTYLSSNSSSSSSTSPAVVMGKRSRSDEADDDDVQVIETEKKKKKKKKKRKTIAVDPCITTVQEEDDEKLDQGFHYKNIDSDQIYDQELTNEFMGYGENAGIVTEEMINMELSQCLVEGDTTYSWVPPDVELQEIINVEDDFEYDDHHHHQCAETTTMGLLPLHHTTTCTSLYDLTSASDMNEEEVPGGANEDEDYGYTLEEWEEHIFSTSPTSVVGNSTSDSYMNQEVVQAHWPSLEFLKLLCS